MALRSLIAGWILCLVAFSSTTAAQDPAKVFIIAGQSNAEGQAPNALYEHQATDTKTKALFAHLRKDGEWVIRNDVFIKYLNRHGKLTLGYGSRKRTGLELEFGTVLGEHFDEPVLLIKTAWGGHSLFRNFRPPSAGMPSEEGLQKELAQAQERVRKNNAKSGRDNPLPTIDHITSAYGASYRNMLTEIDGVMADYETLFPELQGETLEIAGLVWFQGWNDQYGSEGEYESNMIHFINDVRRDLKRPKLPIVIGVMGQNGSQPAQGAMLVVQQAQLAMNKVPEFHGTVKAIRTDVLVDKTAEQLYPDWQDHVEEWQKVGGDRAYHYLGSAIWFNRIGKAMAQTMLELMDTSE
ncbi:MAG: sialate O-acetylesterase [Pirellulales bacterium]|nr:sialate O-acetylesterase [Pirellulales bacterium]